jgi:hypothetical protein
VRIVDKTTDDFIDYSGIGGAVAASAIESFINKVLRRHLFPLYK